MAKSRSESPPRTIVSLRGAEIPRLTRNRLRNLKRFAEGKRRMPGPGRMPDLISSPSKGENQDEVGQGSLIMRQA